MQGQKWDYLVQTIDDLSGLLQEYDRLSIVSFNSQATRDCKLVRMNENGKKRIDKTMKELVTGGATSIGDGLQIAIKVLTDRKYQNKVSSILLLSDGQNNENEDLLRWIISEIQKAGSFTINTFGFGNDHDSELMIEIANLKDGNFYYIEKLLDVGVCFIDCLG